MYVRDEGGFKKNKPIQKKTYVRLRVSACARQNSFLYFLNPLVCTLVCMCIVTLLFETSSFFGRSGAQIF